MAGRKGRGRSVHGILLLDKPAGATSNQALQRAKRLYRAEKAGHTGSIDPLATGMLPICFGAATKLAGYLLDARKTYAVEAELGTATDTGDADGTVIARAEGPAPDPERVRDALASFVGEIEQTPPMYSALKRDGRRLYELARKGIVVDREPRRVEIFEAVLTGYEWPTCRFTVTCSKGTYVRTLVTDLAESLGTLGHVKALRRLAVEPFEEGQMIGFDALEKASEAGFDGLDRLLLPIGSALASWPRVVLDPVSAQRLRNGQGVRAETEWPVGLVRVDEANQGLIGIGEVSPDRILSPKRLLFR